MINPFEEMPPAISHLSQSSISTWLICRARWAFHYIYKIEVPKTSSLTIGSAFDAAFNSFYDSVMRAPRQLTVPEIRDVYLSHIESEAKNTIWPDDDPVEPVKKGAHQYISMFHDDIASRVEPRGVQVRVEKKMPGFLFIGYIDLVDKHGLIIDNKTSGRKWTQDRAVNSMQPAAYSACYEEQFGEKPMGFRFDVAVRTATPSTQQLALVVSEQSQAGFFSLATAIWRDIQNHIRLDFFPPNPSHYLCSRRDCLYWDRCQAKHGIIIRP